MSKNIRIISYNVNGIRAAINKGFIEWLRTDPADIICLQETKAVKDNIDCKAVNDLGYEDYWYSAQKKGYSGVAVFTKIKPDNVLYGNGHRVSDDEGRIIQLDFGDIRLINAYFPSGTSGDLRQAFKYEWLDQFYLFLEELRKTHPKVILCGDYNIAHREIDIHDPKGNKNSSGFLPAERAWMDKFLESGFVDSFRKFVQDPHHYSWWSQRFPTVRLQNKGWRIDYINVTTPLAASLTGAKILPDVKHSDHCPVYLELRNSMIIYNITTKIAWHIHSEWKEWLLNVQLPGIMSTGLFERYQLVRLLETDDDEGPTYALQLHTASIGNIDAYREKHLDNIEKQEREIWGDDIISFKSLMQVIN